MTDRADFNIGGPQANSGRPKVEKEVFEKIEAAAGEIGAAERTLTELFERRQQLELMVKSAQMRVAAAYEAHKKALATLRAMV